MNQKANTTKHGKARHVFKVIGVIILVLLASGGVGYSVYAWQQSSDLQDRLSQKEEDNGRLSEENTRLQVALEEQKKEAEKVQNETAASDKDAALKSLQAYVDARNYDGIKYVAELYVIDGDFAYGSAYPEDRPGYTTTRSWMKKSNGTWLVFFNSQNSVPDESDRAGYKIPQSFIDKVEDYENSPRN